MNIWTERSVRLAQSTDYLDRLYEVYPIRINERRTISDSLKREIKEALDERNRERLLEALFKLELFPIKDSFVAYLRNYPQAFANNSYTVERITDIIFSLGYDEVIKRCTEPKESNRQIGPMFRQWVEKGTLGARVCHSTEQFLENVEENAILNGTDKQLKSFAQEYLGYQREKGLDFIARYNRRYVVAETKFITDFGGHQNGQFSDAVSTMTSVFRTPILDAQVIPIAIMDGVLYIRGDSKMFRYLCENNEKIIISSLLLREFLHSL